MKRNLAAMGKNQAYKAMQRSKMSTTNAAGGPGEEVDDGMVCILPPSIASTSLQKKKNWACFEMHMGEMGLLKLLCYILF